MREKGKSVWAMVNRSVPKNSSTRERTRVTGGGELQTFIRLHGRRQFWQCPSVSVERVNTPDRNSMQIEGAAARETITDCR